MYHTQLPITETTRDCQGDCQQQAIKEDDKTQTLPTEPTNQPPNEPHKAQDTAHNTHNDTCTTAHSTTRTIQTLGAAAVSREALERGHARPEVGEELLLDEQHVPFVLQGPQLGVVEAPAGGYHLEVDRIGGGGQTNRRSIGGGGVRVPSKRGWRRQRLTWFDVVEQIRQYICIYILRV